jgi:glycosyltransferase involved in cell wall biosynthesis
MRLKPLRVAFYGGMFLPLARHIDGNSLYSLDFYWDIELFNQVKNQYPEELLSMPNVHIDRYDNAKTRLLPGVAKITRKFRNYDLLIVSEEGVTFARASERPYAFVPLGYELARFASHGFESKSPFHSLRHAFSKYRTKKGIKASNYILATDFPVFRKAISNLNMQEKWIRKFVPTPIDWSVFDVEIEDNNLKSQKRVFNVFYPNRLLFTKSGVEEETGQTKNTGLAIWGYKHFRDISQLDSTLCLIRRGNTKDLLLLDELIESLQLSDSVVWLGEDHPLTSIEMRNAYMNADVVIGDLGSRWFGKTTIEAFSQGKPIICRLEEKLVQNLNINQGIYLVNTANEIAQNLKLLSGMSLDESKKIALSLRNLYEKNFSEKAVKLFYFSMFSEFLSVLEEQSSEIGFDASSNS